MIYDLEIFKYLMLNRNLVIFTNPYIFESTGGAILLSVPEDVNFQQYAQRLLAVQNNQIVSIFRKNRETFIRKKV